MRSHSIHAGSRAGAATGTVPGPATGHTLHVGGWRVDPAARTMTNGTLERRLSPRAMRLLTLLADYRGEVIDRATLLETVWPDVTVSDESLTQAVAELRRAFGSREIIETVSKAGYRLTAPVVTDVEENELPFGVDDGGGFEFDAYRLCIEARALISRGDRTALELSEALTEEAVARAPRFALALTEASIMAVQRQLYKADGTSRLPVAIERAEAAIRLRPDFAAGYTALGYGLGALERWLQAKAAFGRALLIDPTDGDAHYWAGRTMYSTGDFATAAALAERATALNADCTRSPYLATRAAAVFDAGRAERNAATAFRRIDDRLTVDPGEDRARMMRGPLLAQLGRMEEAADALETHPADGSPLEFYFVTAWAMVGDTDRSLDALDSIVGNGFHHPAWLRAEPAMARISCTRRFGRITRGIGAA